MRLLSVYMKNRIKGEILKWTIQYHHFIIHNNKNKLLIKMAELAYQEKQILQQKTKEQLLDLEFDQFKSQMKVHIDQSRESLCILAQKIEKVIDGIHVLERQITAFGAIIKQRKRSDYEHQQQKLKDMALYFANYATDLKIFDQKNWGYIQSSCNYLEQDDMEKENNDLEEEEKKKENEDNDGSLSLGSKGGYELILKEGQIEISHRKVCIENAFTLPCLFGHRERKNRQFFDRI